LTRHGPNGPDFGEILSVSDVKTVRFGRGGV
jgi:hypothetical protein